MALRYAKGRGVPQNDSEAANWVRRSANQGHIIAQYNLAILYASGRGVEQDDSEAAKWYQLAADQGYTLAQSSLALQYKLGHGVPQDPVRALMWLNLAAARGDSKAARERDAMLQSLNPPQIAEASKLAREWKPTAQRSR